MSFKLLKYTVECSERGDSSSTIAISESSEALEDYLKNTLGKSLEKDKTNPFADYFEIVPSKIVIIPNETQKDNQGAEEEHY